MQQEANRSSRRTAHRGKGRNRRTLGAMAPSAQEARPRGRAADQGPASVRQCLACGRRAATTALVQLAAPVAPASAAAPAPARKAARGRCGYVCGTAACLGQWAEAQVVPAAEALAGVATLAKGRFVGMLGLSRRQGALLVGAGRITCPKQAGQDVTIYVAVDAAERTLRALTAHGETVRCMLDTAQLARAVGQTNVAAVGLFAGRLRARAAYWHRVWYEAGRLAEPAQEARATPRATTELRWRDE